MFLIAFQTYNYTVFIAETETNKYSKKGKYIFFYNRMTMHTVF